MIVKAMMFLKTKRLGISYELLNNFLEEIGEQNVVQLITDNGNNFIMACRLLTSMRPHIFWTLCPTHCINLMLEDIGKISKVKKVIDKERFVRLKRL